MKTKSNLKIINITQGGKLKSADIEKWLIKLLLSQR